MCNRPAKEFHAKELVRLYIGKSFKLQILVTPATVIQFFRILNYSTLMYRLETVNLFSHRTSTEKIMIYHDSENWKQILRISMGDECTGPKSCSTAVSSTAFSTREVQIWWTADYCGILQDISSFYENFINFLIFLESLPPYALEQCQMQN